jgi:uncharacterized protein YjbI with pentapeptide repeats
VPNEEHVALLRSSVDRWNDWRQTTNERPSLTDADLSEADLSRAHLQGADLAHADLSFAQLDRADLADADLRDANLHSANLANANLSTAELRNANLAAADLCGADLSRARLISADLTRSQLIGTNLEGSILDGCRVYGAAVWNVRLAEASQVGLRIGEEDAPEITVDDLEVAQFVYLLLNNAKLRQVIDTVTSKTVLLLGRFTPERKGVLDALHAELRRRGYLPILFDFDKPVARSTTEMVLTLAAMSRFVVADLTDAASVQQELSAIAYSALTSVPVQPVLLRGSRERSMFRDLQGKAPILSPYVYESLDQLIAALSDHVIGPPEQKAQALRAELDRREAEADARRAVR